MEKAFLEPGPMAELGFVLVKRDGAYLSYENDGTVQYNTDYHKTAPEPKGKILLNVNMGYGEYPYVGIRQDGGTRNVYAGVCPDPEFLRLLVFNIR